jgi:hypothetical protein
MKGSYRALRLEFSVAALGQDELERHIHELLRAQHIPDGHPSVAYEIRPVAWGDQIRHELARGEDRLVVETEPEALVSPLVQHINAAAVDSWTDGPVCHAAGIVTDGAALVLPAQQEAGKTTLAAGLIRAGYAYLSDEAVAFDPFGSITPFPKPLSIDPGSWSLFPELEPVADLPTTAYKDLQWQVAPESIRPGSVAEAGCRARWIVFPRYEAGSATELRAIGRAEALVELAQSTFGFADNSEMALEQLADIVRGAECHRLSVGSLHEACDLLGALIGPPEAR